MVKVNSILISPELSSADTDWLLGDVTNKMVATINVTAEWTAEAGLTADDEDMVFATDFTITWNGGNFVQQGFKIGDPIEVSGTASNNGTFTIQLFLDDNKIIVDPATATEVSETAVIEGKAELKGVNFRYNLIENNEAENYNSKVDGNELLFSKAAIDYSLITNVDLIQQGLFKSNHFGSAQIKGTGTINNFIITHTFYIHPFFLFDQLADLISDLPPEYFDSTNCLKYIYQIELLRELTDPNRVHVSNTDSFLLGNTGWFNENFNQGIPKFQITSIDFELSGSPITYADYTAETDVEITINSDDGVFSAGNTKVVLNHFILPEEEAQYKNTVTDFEENFVFDRALQTEGAVAVNGDKFGTDKQVLKTITVTRVSNSTLRVNFKIDLSTVNKSTVGALTDKNFILCVSVQDHTKSTVVSDLVVLRSGTQTYFTDLSNPNLASIATIFNHYNSDTVDRITAGDFVEDIVRGISLIGVDLTPIGGVIPTIKSISVIIRAEKSPDSFVLEQKDFSFAGAIVQSGVQQINIEAEKGVILDDTNPFNNYSLKRRSDLDSGANKFYELIYPFRIRWEDFIQLGGVNADFYDIAEKFNGFNHDWNRYFIGAGWSIKYVTRIVVESGGVSNIIELEKDLIAWNYDDATDWTQTIKVFDIDSGLEIPNNVLTDKIVRVEAEFTKISGAIPDIADAFGTIEVEPFEQGGINIIRNINTLYIHEPDSPFISVLGNKLLKKEFIASNKFKFTTNLDGSKLTGSPKISARIIPTIADEFCLLLEDGDDILLEDESGCIETEH